MKHLYIVLFSLICLSAKAQEILPKYLTDHEIEVMKNYTPPMGRGVTDPPEGPVRTMAEWEELQAVVVTWTGFPEILSQIVDAVKEECTAIIVCSNENTVKNTLNNFGVDYSENVVFVEDEFNSIWVRDYGPNSVYIEETGELIFVDWIYNRPRPKDDDVPAVIAELLGVDMYCTTATPNDLVHTGGNFMADGMGNGFSSRLILEENDASNSWGFSNHSEEDVDEIMDQFMGIKEYIKMENLPFDLIHHIDMHMKLLDEETLLMGEYPSNVADGPQIEANLQYVLENFKTPYGNDYKVVRMPMPPDWFDDFPNTGGDYRTYTNSLIVNETILVPIYELQYDTTALRIWEENMPGYNIVGIDCNSIIPLSGALHCITKEVGVSEPILINMPRMEQACLNESIQIEASIKSSSDITQAALWYGDDQSIMSSIEMNAVGSEMFTAEIPAQINEGRLFYYIEAQNANGKTVLRPLTAPEGSRYVDVINCTVDAEDLLDDILSFEVFPNPANAITCIAIETNAVGQSFELNLLDVHGKLIQQIEQGILLNTNQKFFIDASLFTSGMYLLELQSETQSNVQKLMIK